MARIALTVAVVIGLGLQGAPARADTPCWPPPVSGFVVDPFREPPCRWCAGNRGIEYRVGANVAVRAAATGTVVFAGSVAGVRYVVVELADGWRLTYGRLTTTNVRAGEVVVARSPLGTVDRDFYFGVRIGDTYVDPAPYLGSAVGRRRLVPIDGSPARPTPTVAYRCRR